MERQQQLRHSQQRWSLLRNVNPPQVHPGGFLSHLRPAWYHMWKSGSCTLNDGNLKILLWNHIYMLLLYKLDERHYYPQHRTHSSSTPLPFIVLMTLVSCVPCTAVYLFYPVVPNDYHITEVLYIFYCPITTTCSAVRYGIVSYVLGQPRVRGFANFASAAEYF